VGGSRELELSYKSAGSRWIVCTTGCAIAEKIERHCYDAEQIALIYTEGGGMMR